MKQKSLQRERGRGYWTGSDGEKKQNSLITFNIYFYFSFCCRQANHEKIDPRPHTAKIMIQIFYTKLSIIKNKEEEDTGDAAFTQSQSPS